MISSTYPFPTHRVSKFVDDTFYNFVLVTCDIRNRPISPDRFNPTRKEFCARYYRNSKSRLWIFLIFKLAFLWVVILFYELLVSDFLWSHINMVYQSILHTQHVIIFSLLIPPPLNICCYYFGMLWKTSVHDDIVCQIKWYMYIYECQVFLWIQWWWWLYEPLTSEVGWLTKLLTVRPCIWSIMYIVSDLTAWKWSKKVHHHNERKDITSTCSLSY